jgi:hypothetical protein
VAVSGGLASFNAPLVICQCGRESELAQTGGEINANSNIFVSAAQPNDTVSYTIRGGRLTGNGTLRLGDAPVGEGIFRVEGSAAEVRIDHLSMASDHGVLEYVLDSSGVGNVTFREWLELRGHGTLRVVAPDHLANLPSSLVLLHTDWIVGKFARVELRGMEGQLIYDDQRKEIRLEAIRRTQRPPGGQSK